MILQILRSLNHVSQVTMTEVLSSEELKYFTDNNFIYIYIYIYIYIDVFVNTDMHIK